MSRLLTIADRVLELVAPTSRAEASCPYMDVHMCTSKPCSTDGTLLQYQRVWGNACDPYVDPAGCC